MLTFHEPSHTYRFRDRVVPSVTQVLRSWCDFSHIPPDVLEKARQEGTAVHMMVQHDCNGQPFTWPAWMNGHYHAWCKFKHDSGFECWATEKRLYHTMGYAGTADLFGLLPKLTNVNGPACIDVKRSFYGGPIIGLQTAGYSKAWNEEAPKDMRIPDTNRFALRLDADGKYRLQRYPDPDDWVDFLAALRQHRFRERHYGHRNDREAAPAARGGADHDRSAAGSSA